MFVVLYSTMQGPFLCDYSSFLGGGCQRKLSSASIESCRSSYKRYRGQSMWLHGSMCPPCCSSCPVNFPEPYTTSSPKGPCNDSYSPYFGYKAVPTKVVWGPKKRPFAWGFVGFAGERVPTVHESRELQPGMLTLHYRDISNPEPALL